MTDEVLLQGCLKNDAYAQQELYYKYSPKMLSVCYRYAKSREDAEDMLQEGFIKVFTQISKYENRGSFEVMDFTHYRSHLHQSPQKK